MSATTEHPKAFISYSWTSPEHEQFVLELATALTNHGIEAILDKWDLKPGQDKYVFMESMVVDPKVGRVLVICDRKYQEKANARAGGVGTESQIISSELYGKVKQTKFIPIVCEYDDEGLPCLPVFMKGLIYIDLSTDERYGEGLDQLLRLIYDQPFHQKPKLGAPPAFLTNNGASHVKELAATVRAIQEGKPNRSGLEILLLKSLLSELEKGYVSPNGNDYDEGVYQAISGTKGLRDQLAEYVEAVAGFSGDDPKSLGPFIKLMEGLGGHFGPPTSSGEFYPGWGDYYSFFAHEALLVQTAVLIRHACWKSLRRLLDAIYIVRGSQGETQSADFTSFDPRLVCLDEHRNRRLNLNRTSLSADLLKERCSPEKTTFNELMEADVLLTLKSVVRAAAKPDSGGRFAYWAPRTVVFAPYGNKFPLFMKAADDENRSGIYTVLGVASGPDLKMKLTAAGTALNGLARMGRGSFSHFDFLEAINSEVLVK